MAELLLVIGPLISTVKEKASSYLLDQYKVMEGMEEQRKTLERKLPAILHIIQDAEEKGASRPEVAAWLKDLKTAAYEANDVFDEFKYEALRREAKKKAHHSKLGSEVARLLVPARNPIVFRYRMGKKLCRIVQTIEALVTEMNTFGFRHLQQAQPSRQWRQTDSIIIDSDRDILSRSRDREKKKIVGMLLDQASNMDLMVLPIVGMGGMGKTTFVQLIYNDPAIEKHFELRRWCCVSDDFDVSTIASNICQTNEKGREKSLQELQSIISGKKYLIVLDDVWNRDADKWGKLKTCLKQGGKGSAVLTTTRDAEVAHIMTMGVAEAHNIENLSDEHLKEIVQSRAFSLQNPNIEEQDGILSGFVCRCVGSPLAAKAFGSMLSNRTSINEWKDILAKSNICSEKTGILPILKLSFDDLSSDMKQCFAFCALFPKDYEIDVDLLIQLWMAHDFIPVQEDDNPETVGKYIFEELTRRSFFQDVRQTLRIAYSGMLSLRKSTICKIHDLMHDVALSVLGTECVTIVGKPSVNKLLLNPTRHVFLSMYGVSTVFWKEHVTSLLNHLLKKQTATLHTLFSTEYADSLDISKYTSLRALHLPAYNFRYLRQEQLTRHIQHLRYLNLSSYRFEKLPEGISIMYNLQTLDISHCINLRQLPKDMKYMANLRHLYTNGCISLTCMPPGLGQITSLQTLTYFVIGGGLGCSTIGELQNLNLGGELELSGLQNVTEVLAKAASLENKERLTHLSLEWNDDAREKPDSHNEVLDALKPHHRLEMLSIKSYKGTNLPSWITDLSLLQHLTELHLLGCTLCEEFPQFCRFKALEVLYLENLDKLRSLCSHMVSTPFPALKQLRLHDLESLERWVATEGKEDELTFPVLEEVDIKNCPKMTSLPEAPKLKVVRLDEGKALLSLGIVKSRHMSSISKLMLSVRDTETLPQIDYNWDSSQKLELSLGGTEAAPLSQLSISGCNFFFVSSQSQLTPGVWKWFEHLADFTIENCDVLIYWPEEVFQSLVSLKNLWIMSCNKLIGPRQAKGGKPTQTTDQVLSHLNMIRIHRCESMAQLFILPPSIRFIYIEECPKLEFIWGKEEHLDTYTSLEHCRDPASTTGTLEQSPSPIIRRPCLVHLTIEICDSLVTLPNLPPSLKHLGIFSCEKLCSVSGDLCALESLNICHCNKLQSVNSLGDHPSLQTLFLSDCPSLASLGCDGGRGSYSALQFRKIERCPAIDMKQFY
ncbi:putative disease resistance protein RGA4 [Miscanthus floridulus]|uniref:putative disease resistance protein RGA4 n=1 Tax=Miscanthus floridulus TaxID=154761 RepID=UPI003458AF23